MTNGGKKIVFDTSSLISLVTNDLVDVLTSLRDKFKGEFLIPPSVKKELVDYPINTNKFKFEAVKIQSLIERDILVLHERIDVTTLLHNVNHIYFTGGENIKILHYGEVEALALAIATKADAYIVDERTMRWLIEDPEALRLLLESKLHVPVKMDRIMARNFQNYIKGLNVIRSTELMMVAFELGFLNQYKTREFGNKELIEGILWGLRLHGCAISTEEINDLVKMEGK